MNVHFFFKKSGEVEVSDPSWTLISLLGNRRFGLLWYSCNVGLPPPPLWLLGKARKEEEREEEEKVLFTFEMEPTQGGGGREGRDILYGV